MARSGVYFSDSKSRAGPEPKARLIYVEGVDDANFLDRILADAEADPANVGIVFIEGTGQLLGNLTDLIKTSAYVSGQIKRLAIIRDSNGNPAQSLETLHEALSSLGLPEPPHGTFVTYEAGERSLGVFLVPSDEQQGALEELLMSTVPEDPKLTRADELIAAAEGENGQLDHRSKRVMRAYLASCAVDASGCGRAFKTGWFNHGHAALEPVRVFVQELIAD